MKRFALILFIILLGNALGGIKSSISDVERFRDTLKQATSLFIYEGLPGPFETSLFEHELKRDDLTTIGTYSFYKPPATVNTPTELQTLLASPDSIRPWSGEKMCGGFHPDYCIAWDFKSQRYNALICFGCHEILLTTTGLVLRYDLPQKSYDAFRQLLATFQSKRPKKG